MFAPSSTEVAPAREVTSEIPIVFALTPIPSALGTWRACRGRAATLRGLTVVQTDLTAKALEILKTAVPRARR